MIDSEKNYLSTQSSNNINLQSCNDYQTEFYNMIVHNDRSNIAKYVGSTVKWQLDIYQNNYHQCLFSMLKKTFIRTIILLEKNNYDISYLFNSFIKDNSSVEQNLTLYGARFSSWLKLQADSCNVMMIAADLAMLDYYLYQCYYASNSPLFDIELFLALNDTEKLNSKFQCIPSIRLLKSQFNLIEIQSSDIIKSTQHTDQTHDVFHYLVYRELGIAKYQQIREDRYLLLSDLSEPRTLLHISENSSYNTEVNMPILIQKQWVVMQ
jgi:hypothetical protein